MAKDVYDEINGKIGDLRGVLGSTKDPARAISRANQYLNEAVALLPATAPTTAPEQQRYQLAVKTIDSGEHEITGYARHAMSSRVDEVYRRIGDSNFYVGRRDAGVVHFRASKNPLKAIKIGPGTASKVRQMIAELERYAADSKTYVAGVLTELKNVGLKQPADDSLKAELDRRLDEVKGIVEQQRGDLWGADRRRAIRQSSKLPKK